MTKPLSPAAQKVRHVAICAGPELEGRIAAALKAAADAVVPTNGSRKNNEIRAELLAIAAELEGGND
jgi:phage I-like protein